MSKNVHGLIEKGGMPIMNKKNRVELYVDRYKLGGVGLDFTFSLVTWLGCNIG